MGDARDGLIQIMLNISSKQTALPVLCITAFIWSRLVFVFIDDPEGPNLLIVTVAALILYLFSVTVFGLNGTVVKKFWLAFAMQILIMVSLSVYL